MLVLTQVHEMKRGGHLGISLRMILLLKTLMFTGDSMTPVSSRAPQKITVPHPKTQKGNYITKVIREGEKPRTSSSLPIIDTERVGQALKALR